MTVYFGNNIKAEFKNGDKFYDNGNLSPVFKGEIGHVKEYYNQIEIQIIGIGKRFKQKIPQEFREAFIYNQNVRDAFQAICEFLGVKFICPPQTASAEDEETDTQSSLTDGNENNVSNKINNENKMASTVKNKVKKVKDNKASTTNNNISDIDTSSSNENTEEEDELSNNEEIDTPQNGYGDIAFDELGNILHGSTVIETSPDMAETLISMDQHPLEKYAEDETGVIEDIKRLISGEMFEELHNNVMDYNAITIEPKSSSSSEISTVGDSTGTGDTTSNSNASNIGAAAGSAASSARATHSLQARDNKKPLNGWYNGQLYSNGKIVLSQSYINTLSPAQARAKAKQRNVYTTDTLYKLSVRGSHY